MFIYLGMSFKDSGNFRNSLLKDHANFFFFFSSLTRCLANFCIIELPAEEGE